MVDNRRTRLNATWGVSVKRRTKARCSMVWCRMGLILALTDDGNGVPRGPLAPLLIGLLIAVIGASMGPLTGQGGTVSPSSSAELTGLGG